MVRKPMLIASVAVCFLCISTLLLADGKSRLHRHDLEPLLQGRAGQTAGRVAGKVEEWLVAKEITAVHFDIQ